MQTNLIFSILLQATNKEKITSAMSDSMLFLFIVAILLVAVVQVIRLYEWWKQTKS